MYPVYQLLDKSLISLLTFAFVFDKLNIFSSSQHNGYSTFAFPIKLFQEKTKQKSRENFEHCFPWAATLCQ